MVKKKLVLVGLLLAFASPYIHANPNVGTTIPLEEIVRYFENKPSPYAPHYQWNREKAHVLLISAVKDTDIITAGTLHKICTDNNLNLPINGLFNKKTILDRAHNQEMSLYLRNNFKAMTQEELELSMAHCMQKTWFQREPNQQKINTCLARYNAQNSETECYFSEHYLPRPAYRPWSQEKLLSILRKSNAKKAGEYHKN